MLCRYRRNLGKASSKVYRLHYTSQQKHVQRSTVYSLKYGMKKGHRKAKKPFVSETEDDACND